MAKIDDLLNDLGVAIEARKAAEAALDPVRVAFETAVQKEEKALLALEAYRTANAVKLGQPSKVSIRAQS